MNILKSLPSHLLVFVLLFQIALLGLLVDNLQGDTVTANQLLNFSFGRAPVIGCQMPHFTAYDAQAKRQDAFVCGRPNMLIFTSCDCQLSQINSWGKSAVLHGENLSIISLKLPNDLRRTGEGAGSGQVLAIRQSELATKIGFVGFPIGYHLAPDGTVISIQR